MSGKAKMANRTKTAKVEQTQERVKVLKANGKVGWLWRDKVGK